jgi:hypothetical protein
MNTTLTLPLIAESKSKIGSKIGTKIGTPINKMQYTCRQTGFKIVYIYDKPFVGTETEADRPEKGTHQYWEWVCINGLVEGYDIYGRKQIEKFLLPK